MGGLQELDCPAVKLGKGNVTVGPMWSWYVHGTRDGHLVVGLEQLPQFGKFYYCEIIVVVLYPSSRSAEGVLERRDFGSLSSPSTLDATLMQEPDGPWSARCGGVLWAFDESPAHHLPGHVLLTKLNDIIGRSG